MYRKIDSINLSFMVIVSTRIWCSKNLLLLLKINYVVWVLNRKGQYFAILLIPIDMKFQWLEKKIKVQETLHFIKFKNLNRNIRTFKKLHRLIRKFTKLHSNFSRSRKLL